MRLLLNVIWLIFSGFWMAIGYAVAGVVACLLIVTIPFGIASFRIAAYALWPFGRRADRRRDAGAGSTIGNVLWIVLFGWWLALGHIVSAVAFAVTIIGIPLAIGSIKMVPLSLLPLGREIRAT